MSENARWYQSPHNPWEVVDEDGNTVAEVFGEEGEIDARVRLFAAAPAMLAALELVREQFGYSLPAECLTKIDQAIRLAKEGR